MTQHAGNTYPMASRTDSNLTIIWDETINPKAVCVGCSAERVSPYAFSYTADGRTIASVRGMGDTCIGRDVMHLVTRGILPAMTYNDAIGIAQQNADDEA